jgi:hypothetical protein
MFEGVLAPADDARWLAHLAKESPINTTAGMTLPFWGFDDGDFTLTCQLLNPFNNELQFDAVAGRLRLSCVHEFTPNNEVKRFSMRFTIGAASPIEPACEYRRWLETRREFVSLAEKIKRTPDVAKLLGAAHLYLQGEGPLNVNDVRDWKGFTRQLRQQGRGTNDLLGRQIWQLLGGDAQKSADEIIHAEWPDRYNKGVVIGALNQALGRTNFPQRRRQHRRQKPSEAELFRRNGQVLAASFSEFLKPIAQWGEGISPQMIRELAAAGLDRLWLGAPGWEGFVRQPETVKLARGQGYLIGTYDSYHSIHSSQARADETWPTAQFDTEIYGSGAIIKADSKPRMDSSSAAFS